MAASRTKRFFSAIGRGLKSVGPGLVETFGSGYWMPADLTPGDYNSVGDGTSSSVIMLPLRWLQRNSPQAILRVSKRSEDGKSWTPIDPTDGIGAARMLRLIDQPNDFYDGDALEQATRLSEELDGNAYWLKVRNSMGAVVQLWWVPHTLIAPARDAGSTDFITHYEYKPDGVVRRVPVEDVVHFRVGLDPGNPMKGMSALKSVLREVYTDDEASAYAAALLKNRGVPGLVVSPDTSGTSPGMGQPDDGDLEAVKQKFEQATTGGNRGRTIVMRGATKLQTFGFNPSEMSVRELRRVPEERASGATGVPAIVCGLGAGLDRSTFANMSEAREAAAEEALIPGWRRRARTVKHQLLPDFEPNPDALRVDHDLSEVRVLSEDQDKIATRMVTLVQGGLATIGEGRQPLGLEVDESHDVFLRPLGSVEVPAGSTQGEALALEQADNPDAAAPKALSGGVKSLTAEQRRNLQTAMARVRSVTQDVFAKRLEDTFAHLGEHVVSSYREHAKGRKDEGDPPVSEVVAATMQRAELGQWVATKLALEYDRHYRTVLNETRKTINATLGLSIETSASAVELAVLREGGTQLGLVDIPGQTRDAIFNAITDAREKGLNPVDTERQIRSYVTNGGADAHVSSRAMRIARTETRHAQNHAAIETYKATGVYDAIHVLDNRTGHDDPDCVARDGSIASFDQALAYESDEHPNGTLDITTPATSKD